MSLVPVRGTVNSPSSLVGHSGLSGGRDPLIVGDPQLGICLVVKTRDVGVEIVLLEVSFPASGSRVGVASVLAGSVPSWEASAFTSLLRGLVSVLAGLFSSDPVSA